jgi:hypothetical protein
VIVLLIVAAGFYYFGTQQGAKKGYEEGVKATKAAYEELIKKAGTAVVSPVENLPTTNPFEKVRVNPFEAGYKNPFE